MNTNIKAMCAEIAQTTTNETISQLTKDFPDRMWRNVYTRCMEIASGAQIEPTDKLKIPMMRKLWSTSTGKDYFSHITD